ncbi:hypothetical protein [Pseudoalteromonas sp. T1lg122]|uniref:hypothetical protein n=1 Tax=Pseudoalteromonas sp. T1lg122 TaxID=2077094 RepID=UPI000CF61713|nr:hypothetical protein [Pseudoalteromonas sp. T1lg122]
MKYFVLGAMPPPLGGVSIYCMRRVESLKNAGRNVTVYNSTKKMSLILLILHVLCFRITNRKFVVEVNISNPIALFFLTVSGVARSSLFLDHNSSRRLKNGKIYSFCFKHFCRSAQSIAVVNPNLINNYDFLPKVKQSKIKVQSPFLAPSECEIAEAKKCFPKHLEHLLKGDIRDIVLASAWMPVSNETENDLYGIKDTLKVFESCLALFPQITFVLMIGKFDDSIFSMEIKELINELKEYSNFEFIEGGLSQLPLLPKTSTLLRLTKTDGDSLSVREVLHFGGNVIATDVTVRPDKVETVAVNDIEATCKKLIINLEKLKELD